MLNKILSLFVCLGLISVGDVIASNKGKNPFTADEKLEKFRQKLKVKQDQKGKNNTFEKKDKSSKQMNKGFKNKTNQKNH